MSKIIITIVGQDRVGIVAKTCNYLADHNMNILDITQTILQEYFNMMMIVDISGSKTSFDDMAHELDKLGQEDRRKDSLSERRDFYQYAQNLSKYFQKGRKTND